jgi:hypothetical protein
MIAFSSNVTEPCQLKEKFEQLANTHVLTRIYDRRYFFTMLIESSTGRKDTNKH